MDFKSKYKIGDTVAINFITTIIKNCIIDEVHFSESKVYYDVLVPIELNYTRVEKIDSAFVNDNEYKY